MPWYDSNDDTNRSSNDSSSLFTPLGRRSTPLNEESSSEFFPSLSRNTTTPRRETASSHPRSDKHKKKQEFGRSAKPTSTRSQPPPPPPSSDDHDNHKDSSSDSSDFFKPLGGTTATATTMMTTPKSNPKKTSLLTPRRPPPQFQEVPLQDSVSSSSEFFKPLGGRTATAQSRGDSVYSVSSKGWSSRASSTSSSIRSAEPTPTPTTTTHDHGKPSSKPPATSSSASSSSSSSSTSSADAAHRRPLSSSATTHKMTSNTRRANDAAPMAPSRGQDAEPSHEEERDLLASPDNGSEESSSLLEEDEELIHRPRRRGLPDRRRKVQTSLRHMKASLVDRYWKQKEPWTRDLAQIALSLLIVYGLPLAVYFILEMLTGVNVTFAVYVSVMVFLWSLALAQLTECVWPQHAPRRQGAPQAVASAIICAYLPNEEDIIVETVRHFLNHDYEPGIQVILAYNSPFEEMPVENKLRALSDKHPNLLILKVEHSRSKAQNLNAAMDFVVGDFVGVFDADHLPDAGSYERAWKWLSNGYDVVQGRSVSRNAGASWMARMVAVETETLYAVTHPGRTHRDKWGIFGGSNGYWKSPLLKQIGLLGNMLTEDIDATMRVLEMDGKIGTDPNLISRELSTTTAMHTWNQRLRWAQGWFQVSMKHFAPLMLSSELSLRQKYGIFVMLLMREVNPWVSGQVLPLIVYWAVQGQNTDLIIPLAASAAVFNFVQGPMKTFFAYFRADEKIKNPLWFLEFAVFSFVAYTGLKHLCSRVAHIKQAFGECVWRITPRSADAEQIVIDDIIPDDGPLETEVHSVGEPSMSAMSIYQFSQMGMKGLKSNVRESRSRFKDTLQHSQSNRFHLSRNDEESTYIAESSRPSVQFHSDDWSYSWCDNSLARGSISGRGSMDQSTRSRASRFARDDMSYGGSIMSRSRASRFGPDDMSYGGSLLDRSRNSRAFTRGGDDDDDDDDKESRTIKSDDESSGSWSFRGIAKGARHAPAEFSVSNIAASSYRTTKNSNRTPSEVSTNRDMYSYGKQTRSRPSVRRTVSDFSADSEYLPETGRSRRRIDEDEDDTGEMYDVDLDDALDDLEEGIRKHSKKQRQRSRRASRSPTAEGIRKGRRRYRDDEADDIIEVKKDRSVMKVFRKLSMFASGDSSVFGGDGGDSTIASGDIETGRAPAADASTVSISYIKNLLQKGAKGVKRTSERLVGYYDENQDDTFASFSTDRQSQSTRSGSRYFPKIRHPFHKRKDGSYRQGYDLDDTSSKDHTLSKDYIATGDALPEVDSHGETEPDNGSDSLNDEKSEPEKAPEPTGEKESMNSARLSDESGESNNKKRQRADPPDAGTKNRQAQADGTRPDPPPCAVETTPSTAKKTKRGEEPPNVSDETEAPSEKVGDASDPPAELKKNQQWMDEFFKHLGYRVFFELGGQQGQGSSRSRASGRYKGKARSRGESLSRLGGHLPFEWAMLNATDQSSSRQSYSDVSMDRTVATTEDPGHMWKLKPFEQVKPDSRVTFLSSDKTDASLRKPEDVASDVSSQSNLLVQREIIRRQLEGREPPTQIDRGDETRKLVKVATDPPDCFNGNVVETGCPPGADPPAFEAPMPAAYDVGDTPKVKHLSRKHHSSQGQTKPPSKGKVSKTDAHAQEPTSRPRKKKDIQDIQKDSQGRPSRPKTASQEGLHHEHATPQAPNRTSPRSPKKKSNPSREKQQSLPSQQNPIIDLVESANTPPKTIPDKNSKSASGISPASQVSSTTVGTDNRAATRDTTPLQNQASTVSRALPTTNTVNQPTGKTSAERAEGKRGADSQASASSASKRQQGKKGEDGSPVAQAGLGNVDGSSTESGVFLKSTPTAGRRKESAQTQEERSTNLSGLEGTKVANDVPKVREASSSMAKLQGTRSNVRRVNGNPSGLPAEESVRPPMAPTSRLAELHSVPSYVHAYPDDVSAMAQSIPGIWPSLSALSTSFDLGGQNDSEDNPAEMVRERTADEGMKIVNVEEQHNRSEDTIPQEARSAVVEKELSGGEPSVMESDSSRPEPLVVDNNSSPAELSVVDNSSSPAERLIVKSDSSTAEPLIVESDSSQAGPLIVESDSSHPEPVIVDSDSSHPEPLIVESDSSQSEPLIVESHSSQPEALIVESDSRQPEPMTIVMDVSQLEPLMIESHSSQQEPSIVESHSGQSERQSAQGDVKPTMSLMEVKSDSTPQAEPLTAVSDPREREQLSIDSDPSTTKSPIIDCDLSQGTASMAKNDTVGEGPPLIADMKSSQAELLIVEDSSQAIASVAEINGHEEIISEGGTRSELSLMDASNTSRLYTSSPEPPLVQDQPEPELMAADSESDVLTGGGEASQPEHLVVHDEPEAELEFDGIRTNCGRNDSSSSYSPSTSIQEPFIADSESSRVSQPGVEEDASSRDPMLGYSYNLAGAFVESSSDDGDGDVDRDEDDMFADAWASEDSGHPPHNDQNPHNITEQVVSSDAEERTDDDSSTGSLYADETTEAASYRHKSSISVESIPISEPSAIHDTIRRFQPVPSAFPSFPPTSESSPMADDSTIEIETARSDDELDSTYRPTVEGQDPTDPDPQGNRETEDMDAEEQSAIAEAPSIVSEDEKDQVYQSPHTQDDDRELLGYMKDDSKHDNDHELIGYMQDDPQADSYYTEYDDEAHSRCMHTEAPATPDDQAYDPYSMSGYASSNPRTHSGDYISSNMEEARLESLARGIFTDDVCSGEELSRTSSAAPVAESKPSASKTRAHSWQPQQEVPTSPRRRRFFNPYVPEDVEDARSQGAASSSSSLLASTGELPSEYLENESKSHHSSSMGSSEAAMVASRFERSMEKSLDFGAYSSDPPAVAVDRSRHDSFYCETTQSVSGDQSVSLSVSHKSPDGASSSQNFTQYSDNHSVSQYSVAASVFTAADQSVVSTAYPFPTSSSGWAQQLLDAMDEEIIFEPSTATVLSEQMVVEEEDDYHGGHAVASADGFATSSSSDQDGSDSFESIRLT